MAVSFFSLIFMTFVILIACGVDYIRKYSHVDPFVFEFKNPTTSITRITDTRIIRLDRDKDAVNFFNDSLGCESFTEDQKTGDIYTGLADGRLQRLRISYNLYFNIDAVITDVLRVNNTDVGSGYRCSNPDAEHDCGRLLGMEIWSRSEGTSLVACEGIRGLIQIDDIDNDSRPHEIKILSNRVTTSDGTVDRINFCNSVAIAPDNSAIYFTDSSKRQRSDFIYDALDGRPNGRLLRYDVEAQTTSVVRDGLAFANGVVISHGGDFLLVVELMRGLVMKYGLTGPNAGVWSVFCVLPFLPDNIRKSHDGASYLIGGFAWPHPFVKSQLSTYVFLRKALGSLSAAQLDWLMPVMSREVGFVAVVDGEGKMIQIIEGSTAGAVKTSEGFETSSGILLWGSFDHQIPLIASRGLHWIVNRRKTNYHSDLELIDQLVKRMESDEVLGDHVED